MGGRGSSSGSKSDGQKTKLKNPKQRKTFEKIFRHPMPNDMRWNDIESFFEYIGYTKHDRGGSRVSFTKDGAPTYYEHIPHPSSQTPPATVKRVKNYLKGIGMKP